MLTKKSFSERDGLGSCFQTFFLRLILKMYGRTINLSDTQEENKILRIDNHKICPQRLARGLLLVCYLKNYDLA
jgi:hypothetical protein